MNVKQLVCTTFFVLTYAVLVACSDGKNGHDGINGADGENGKDGQSCSIEELKKDDGYKVICGGDSVGVLLNGQNGIGGKDGDDGANCEFIRSDDEIQIACGKDTVDVDLNGYEPSIDTIVEVKYMCGATAYDITEQFCVGVTLYDLCDGDVYDPFKESCDK